MVCLFSEFFFCVGYLLLFVFKDGRGSLGRQPWLAWQLPFLFCWTRNFGPFKLLLFKISK